MPSDFIASSVAHGLTFGAFEHLSQKDKKRLIRLIARISEASYRRGLQHGGIFGHRVDVYAFRYKHSLDKSPFTDVEGAPKNKGTSSTWRLFCENGVLRDLGFSDPNLGQISKTAEKANEINDLQEA